MLLTDKQTDKQTNAIENKTSFAKEVKMTYEKTKLTFRPKKRSTDEFDSFDRSYCQFLIKL